MLNKIAWLRANTRTENQELHAEKVRILNELEAYIKAENNRIGTPLELKRQNEQVERDARLAARGLV